MNKIYPRKQALWTGLISALFATIAFAIGCYANDHYGWGMNPVSLRGLIGMFTIVILGVGIYTGMQSIKRSNGGTLTYGQAVAAGVLIELTTGVIMALIGVIYTTIINPGYAAYMLAENKAAMLAAGKSAHDIAKTQVNLQMQYTVPMQIFQAVVGQTAVGTVISLIMALFIKTSPPKPSSRERAFKKSV
jgi:hypothetical protein